MSAWIESLPRYLRSPVRLAAKHARKSRMRCTHGCILLYGDRVVAVAFNDELRFAVDSLHAEERVLRKIRKDMDPRRLTLIVVRVNRFGERRPSRPCASCENAIRRVGIGKVLYS